MGQSAESVSTQIDLLLSLDRIIAEAERARILRDRLIDAARRADDDTRRLIESRRETARA